MPAPTLAPSAPPAQAPPPVPRPVAARVTFSPSPSDGSCESLLPLVVRLHSTTGHVPDDTGHLEDLADSAGPGGDRRRSGVLRSGARLPVSQIAIVDGAPRPADGSSINSLMAGPDLPIAKFGRHTRIRFPQSKGLRQTGSIRCAADRPIRDIHRCPHTAALRIGHDDPHDVLRHRIDDVRYRIAGVRERRAGLGLPEANIADPGPQILVQGGLRHRITVTPPAPPPPSAGAAMTVAGSYTVSPLRSRPPAVAWSRIPCRSV